jgi:hypothetical protein
MPGTENRKLGTGNWELRIGNPVKDVSFTAA